MYCDPWDGYNTNTLCNKCYRWAKFKVSKDTNNTIGHGFYTIGYFCEKHLPKET